MTGIRLRELAAELGREVEGDGEALVTGVAAVERAGPADLAYARFERFADALRASRAGAVIAAPGLHAGGRPPIRAPNPGLDFARAAQRLVPIRGAMLAVRKAIMGGHPAAGRSP